MTHKVALVTGAGRGIGRAICLRLAGEGYDIAGVARTAAELRETGDQVAGAGGRFELLRADVTDPAQVQEVVQRCVDALGRIDVLCNNAGYGWLGPFAEMPVEAFDRLVAVNVAAVFHFCRAVWPVMTAQGGGTIINISSVAADDPFPGFAVYGATKAWVNTFTKGLATDGVSCGIRVLGVAPGAVETQMLREAVPDFPADQTLAPGDIAEVVSELVDLRSTHASGEVVVARKQG
jgi:NAD(P)-dependent dehydrogenase (short-subunit alcohol dehydrogenase family)